MRIGIAGAGTMAEVHAAAWRSLGANLVGYVSLRSAGTDDALAKRFELRARASYADLLQEIDIIDICTPTSQHRSMVLEAAAAGKHVICEKPIATTVEDAQVMIDACRNVRLFVGMVVRFFPQYRSARQLVAAGHIGTPGVLRLKRVSYVPQRAPDSWYFDESISGGMIVDLMSHDIDYARWLAGEIERVYAVRTNAKTGAAQYVQAVLRFRNGAMALIEGGWAYPPGIFRTSFDLAGSEGLIEWCSDQPPPITSFRLPATEAAASVGLPTSGLAEDPYTSEIRHAFECIQSGTAFDVTPQDALEALRISLAVKRSTETGQPIEP
ncbi:MAG: Gfo/Idh/MocA family oxidoreductase [Verrucomicrobia bacterium]|nr:Gfo/Idh/MocA family oxidoreductase [Verrucomicrobiota bacterium]